MVGSLDAGPAARVPATGVAVAVLISILAGCSDPEPGPASTPTRVTTRLALVEVVAGLSSPVFVDQPRGDDRLFIVEQPGTVRSVTGGKLDPEPFLDIRHKVLDGGERGLLGLAFAPDFRTSGTFYVHYSDDSGDTALERYVANDGGASAQALLLHVDQPYSNHNGGMLAFGPDGMLYMGLGDGGSGGDPQGNGQSLSTLLGKVLRLDVGCDAGGECEAGAPLRVPRDNPFVAREGARAEIWAYGLRNPWRFSFDVGGEGGEGAGDLWVADVGQNRWEEVNRLAAGTKGANLGWKRFEGSHVFDGQASADGALAPVAEYDHSGPRCSVTGGYVYRGDRVPSLRGSYLYADYCSGELWRLDAAAPGGPELLLTTGFRVSSFGQDQAGEVYVVDHEGAVHRIGLA